MAVCVGCGLEVNNGILEVNVCGTPVIPNTTTGGLQCDTGTENGCLKVVLNDSHAGCGLNAVGGALEFDPCLNGGILCGATDDDPEDNCAYVNVVGQGAGPCLTYVAAVPGTTLARVGGSCVINECDHDGTNCVPLIQNVEGSGIASACPSPNCNGLVRTCDGLWAPPSLGSINFSCGQMFTQAPTPISNLLWPLNEQSGNLVGSSDGYPGYNTDMAYGIDAGNQIIVNSFVNDDCNPIDAMSWTAFDMNMEVPGGELWRFGLHERICTDAGAVGGNALTGHCTGGWALQSSQYIDTRAFPANQVLIMSLQIQDNSTWRFGAGKLAAAGFERWRMEAIITGQRLEGTSSLATNHRVFWSDFQYRNMGHAFHHRLNQNCGISDTNQ